MASHVGQAAQVIETIAFTDQFPSAIVLNTCMILVQLISSMGRASRFVRLLETVKQFSRCNGFSFQTWSAYRY